MSWMEDTLKQLTAGVDGALKGMEESSLRGSVHVQKAVLAQQRLDKLHNMLARQQ